jgi:hypothetical protein
MMTWTNTKLPASFSQRCRSLSVGARAVRERAVMRGCDLDGWRLSRLMREASTDAQVNVAERQFSAWLRANPLKGADQGNGAPG